MKQSGELQTQELILANWLVGKKRTFNGVVYATRKDRRIAYQRHLEEKHASD